MSLAIAAQRALCGRRGYSQQSQSHARKILVVATCDTSSISELLDESQPSVQAQVLVYRHPDANGARDLVARASGPAAIRDAPGLKDQEREALSHFEKATRRSMWQIKFRLPVNLPMRAASERSKRSARRLLAHHCTPSRVPLPILMRAWRKVVRIGDEKFMNAKLPTAARGITARSRHVSRTLYSVLSIRKKMVADINLYEGACRPSTAADSCARRAENSGIRPA